MQLRIVKTPSLKGDAIHGLYAAKWFSWVEKMKVYVIKRVTQRSVLSGRLIFLIPPRVVSLAALFAAVGDVENSCEKFCSWQDSAFRSEGVQNKQQKWHGRYQGCGSPTPPHLWQSALRGEARCSFFLMFKKWFCFESPTSSWSFVSSVTDVIIKWTEEKLSWENGWRESHIQISLNHFLYYKLIINESFGAF